MLTNSWMNDLHENSSILHLNSIVTMLVTKSQNFHNYDQQNILPQYSSFNNITIIMQSNAERMLGLVLIFGYKLREFDLHLCFNAAILFDLNRGSTWTFLVRLLDLRIRNFIKIATYFYQFEFKEVQFWFLLQDHLYPKWWRSSKPSCIYNRFVYTLLSCQLINLLFLVKFIELSEQQYKLTLIFCSKFHFLVG